MMLRIFFIGGPNKMWSVDAYNYIEQNHPKLWIIESNATYRGWFTGGDQSGDLGNAAFVAVHIKGHGALGDYFATKLRGVIKMGDTPSVAYLLHNNPEDPTQPGWGGRYVRIWDGRKTIFNRLTTADDRAEVFGVVEFVLPLPARETQMIFDNRIPVNGLNDGKALRFRFSPRDAKLWRYVLNGQEGSFTAVPPPDHTRRPSMIHPNWWTDDPDPRAAEGVHPGAKSVNQWRAEFLKDFSARLDRCNNGKR